MVKQRVANSSKKKNHNDACMYIVRPCTMNIPIMSLKKVRYHDCVNSFLLHDEGMGRMVSRFSEAGLETILFVPLLVKYI